MIWNVQGLINKLCDVDFISILHNHSVIFLCETWHNKSSIIDVNGFTTYHCPRPKYNRRAKRNSGGLVVYCKSAMADGISTVKRNENGIMWIKFDKVFFNLENDIYVCHCYIPPENSRLYLTVDNLRNLDFFDCISEDVRYFSGIGDVYMCGDLNSRCGRLSDRVDQLGLDRYVNLPDEDEHSYTVGPRASSDERVNIFGRKLISLCKEHDMVIMNGRLEQGRFTCFTQSGASVVDYFIAQTKNVQQVYDMYVSDLTEFSDHCFLAISININNTQTANIDKTFETFDWESAE